MALPSRRGWGPGWPTNRSRDMVWVRAPLSGARLQVHRSIAFLLTDALAELEYGGFRLDHGPRDVDDEWGFNNRAVGGTRVPSVHSWGLAVDFNAQDYPQGQSRRRPPQWVVDVMRRHGFAWGGYWSGRRADPMHFEFDGSPQDAANITAAIQARKNTPKPVPEVVDWAKLRKFAAAWLLPHVRKMPNLSPGAEGLHVVILQRALNTVTGSGLKDDGKYGVWTEGVVKNLQRFFGITAAQEPYGHAHNYTRMYLVSALTQIKDGKE